MLLTIAMMSSGCGGSSSGGGSGAGDDPIDPAAQPDELAKSLTVASGDNTVTQQDGEPPAGTGTADDPTVTLARDTASVVAGETIELGVDFDAFNNNTLASLFVRVEGAGSYTQIDFPPGTTKAVTSQTLEITLPDNLDIGEFCLDINGQDSGQLVSDAERICIQVESGCSAARTYDLSGLDLVAQIYEFGIDDFQGRSNPLSGTLTIGADGSCDLVENNEGYSGSCTVNGNDITVEDFMKGTITPNEVTLIKLHSTQEVEATDETAAHIETVAAYLFGESRATCESQVVSSSNLSISGEEAVFFEGNGLEESDGSDFEFYDVTGSLSISGSSCQVQSSEGNYACSISGNHFTAAGGLIFGTVTDTSVTYVLPPTTPQPSDSGEGTESFYLLMSSH